MSLRSFEVVPLGLEPRLFCTKNRRVASYTMGQFKLSFVLPPNSYRDTPLDNYNVNKDISCKGLQKYNNFEFQKAFFKVYAITFMIIFILPLPP